jgi:hypothetical protein
VTFDDSTWVRGYDLLGGRIGYRFVGPNIRGLATPASGGTGDGYLIPAPYNATTFVNLTLRDAF